MWKPPLLKHPAVRDVAVVAHPDPIHGEVVVAFVVLNPDTPGSEDLINELQQTVKTRYAAHAYPRRIYFVDELPRDAQRQDAALPAAQGGTSHMTEAVLIDIVRTPSGKGKPGGQLSSLHPVDLLAGTIRDLMARTGIDPGIVDDVITRRPVPGRQTGDQHRPERRPRRRPSGDHPGNHRGPAMRLQPAGDPVRRERGDVRFLRRRSWPVGSR